MARLTKLSAVQGASALSSVIGIAPSLVCSVTATVPCALTFPPGGGVTGFAAWPLTGKLQVTVAGDGVGRFGRGAATVGMAAGVCAAPVGAPVGAAVGVAPASGVGVAAASAAGAAARLSEANTMMATTTTTTATIDPMTETWRRRLACAARRSC